MESISRTRIILKKLEIPHEKDAVFELTPWELVLLRLTGISFLYLLQDVHGDPGASLASGLGFPIINRYVWGLYGNFFPLLMRIMLSFVWYGTQTWFGGQSVKVVIAAIWPSFLTMKNTLPTSASMETNDFIATMIFWLVSLPLLAIPPEYYKVPLRYATLSITVTAFAMFIWALAKEGGGGPLLSDPTRFMGLDNGITTQIANISAGILNQSDYTRFARKPGDQIMSQIICVPIMSILTALVGVICTSCAAGFYPDEELLWQPYDLLIAIQTHGGNGARAATFFAGCAFVISQWGINISGNGVSGGIDLSGLFPKYINIRRGAFLTACAGLAINPWKLVNTANTFITVLSSFAVFLGPATGLMVTDYVVIRRRKLRLSHLYNPSRDSIYWYTSGINLRAVIAWINGVWPLMPGFIAAVRGETTSEGWMHTYDLAWLFGFFVSGATYVILCRIWPIKGLGEIDEEDVFGTFEEISSVGHGHGVGVPASGQSDDGSKDVDEVVSDEAVPSFEYKSWDTKA
ncbi:hypothetical protein D9758_004636 [Tetrapyrgos nigripes]|uniref:Uracil permease n=1 Tax=Tetrapyrgos nigripes TaxID=182062 RepID=A0A8H5H0S9_9AGAR|nr:hypothetical protein D9758_004636 [Tetrapyrgos nigripes]